MIKKYSFYALIGILTVSALQSLLYLGIVIADIGYYN